MWLVGFFFILTSANGGWSMNGGGWVPNGGGWAPNGGGWTQNGGGWVPNGGGWAPNGGGWTPNGGGWSPNGGGWTPNGGGWNPNGAGWTQINGGWTQIGGGWAPSGYFGGGWVAALSWNGDNATYNGVSLHGRDWLGPDPSTASFRSDGVWDGLTNKGLKLPNGEIWNAFSTSSLNAIPLSDFSSSSTNMTAFFDLFNYLVRCALPSGQTWTMNLKDTKKTYEGSLGLAPTWSTDPLTQHQQSWISACLLSQVNAEGKHVYLSVRGTEIQGALEPREVEEYHTYEGAFFGELFSLPVRAFSCQGKPRSEALAEASTRVVRDCTDWHPNCPLSIGYCADFCKNFILNYGYSECYINGTMYEAVVNVYLQSDLEGFVEAGAGSVSVLSAVLIFVTGLVLLW